MHIRAPFLYLSEAQASPKTITFIPGRDGKVYERRITGAGEFVTPAENITVLDEIRPPKWRIHPVEILLFFLIVAGSFVLIHRPWNFLVAIVLSLCCGIYVWNRMKISQKS